MSTFNKQALPPTLPYYKEAERKRDDDPWQEAYRTCRRYDLQSESDLDHMHFRLLGYLIREAIYDESRDGICREINSCEGDKDRLHKLADLYFRLFVRIFRSSRNSAPSPSPHPSRASFNTDRESLEPDLRSTARHANRTRTLQRDNNRCIVTGALSLDSLQPSETPLLWGVLQVAHILPRSMNDRVATSEESRNQAAEVWTIFRRFGKIAPEELNGDGINRLENLMTLWDTIHALFDKLCVV